MCVPVQTGLYCRNANDKNISFYMLKKFSIHKISIGHEMGKTAETPALIYTMLNFYHRVVENTYVAYDKYHFCLH